ncbi:MAG: DUF1700 domain-containing protein [Clostridia bacterium]|nr:DUF1700 domain-containing protein [Clostridia bacterium]
MNKNQYLDKLRNSLKKLPEAEVSNAINYYTEYFEDAGIENEQKIINELGEPKKLATVIIADYAIKNKDNSSKTINKSLSTLWIIIIAIFASPVALPLAIALVSIIFALLIVVFAVLLSFYVASIGICIAAVGLLIVGFSIFTIHFPTSLSAIGAGLIVASLGILLFWSITYIAKKTIYLIAKLFSKVVSKGGK